MNKTAIIQVSSIAGTWRDVSRCSAKDAVVMQRLTQAKAQYPKRQVRAVDSKGNLLGLL